MLVKSDEFRPIKVDGNPDHPMTRAASDLFSQGSLLDLYDPDRSQHVTYRGENAVPVGELPDGAAARPGKQPGGQGLYILSATVTSPTLAAQWKDAQKRYPKAKLVQYDPVNRDSARRASKAAFGDFYDAQYQLDRPTSSSRSMRTSSPASPIPGFHQAGARLREAPQADGPSHRHEPALRGREHADHDRLQGRASAGAAREPHGGIRAALALQWARAAAAPAQLDRRAAEVPRRAGSDLKANAGKCVVIPGEQQSPRCTWLRSPSTRRSAMWARRSSTPKPCNPMPSIQIDDLKSLVADMNAGKVDWLVILNANPVYTAPADLDFADALQQGAERSCISAAHFDETGADRAPGTSTARTTSRSWSDARAYDGTRLRSCSR